MSDNQPVSLEQLSAKVGHLETVLKQHTIVELEEARKTAKETHEWQNAISDNINELTNRMETLPFQLVEDLRRVFATKDQVNSDLKLADVAHQKAIDDAESRCNVKLARLDADSTTKINAVDSKVSMYKAMFGVGLFMVTLFLGFVSWHYKLISDMTMTNATTFAAQNERLEQHMHDKHIHVGDKP